jgi:hypothetical protein
MITTPANGTGSVVHSNRIHNEILSANGPLLAVNTCSEKKILIPRLQLLGFKRNTQGFLVDQLDQASAAEQPSA